MSERTDNTKNKTEQKKQGFSSNFIEMVAAEFRSIRAEKRNK